MLAITLFNNALLNEHALARCKFQLSSLAEARTQYDLSEKKVLVDASLLDSLNEFLSNAQELKAGGSSASAHNSVLENCGQQKIEFFEDV